MLWTQGLWEPNTGNQGNPLGTQVPLQASKDSVTEPREPRNSFGNTGTFPLAQGFRDRSLGPKETLCEHMDLCRDPRTQGPNPGLPRKPLWEHWDLPMEPRIQGPNPGNPGLRDRNPGNPGLRDRTQGTFPWTQGRRDRTQESFGSALPSYHSPQIYELVVR